MPRTRSRAVSKNTCALTRASVDEEGETGALSGSSRQVPPEGSDLVDALRRWYDAGAAWQVVARTPHEVTVAMLRCDGGEEVERLTSGAPAWLAYLADRETSDD